MVKTRLLTSIALLILSLFSTASIADAVGVNVGIFNGIAFNYQRPLSEQLSVQFELTTMPYDNEFEQDGVEYEIEYDRNNLGALLVWVPQWHWTQQYLYFSGGIYVGDHNWTLESKPQGTSWDIGDSTYYSNNLRLKGKASFAKSSPFLGVGIQKTFAERFTVRSDIGLLYIGKGALSYKASGRVYISADDFNAGNNNYISLNDAEFQQDLEKKRTALEDELEDYSLLPMFHIGIAYAF